MKKYDNLINETIEETRNRIPADRCDDKCLECGRGMLTEGVIIRTWENYIQWVFECDTCGNEVVDIEELKNQNCPQCGMTEMYSVSLLHEINHKENEKQKLLNDLLEWFSQYPFDSKAYEKNAAFGLHHRLKDILGEK